MEDRREETVERERRLLEGEAVAVRCAHGNTVLYPLAEVAMEVDGKGEGSSIKEATSIGPIGHRCTLSRGATTANITSSPHRRHNGSLCGDYSSTSTPRKRESPETKRKKCRSQTQKDHRGGTTTEQELGW